MRGTRPAAVERLEWTVEVSSALARSSRYRGRAGASAAITKRVPSQPADAPSVRTAASPRPSPIPPAATTGRGDRVDDRRDQDQRGDLAAHVTAGLPALRDHDVDAGIDCSAGFGGVADRHQDDRAGLMSRSARAVRDRPRRTRRS